MLEYFLCLDLLLLTRLVYLRKDEALGRRNNLWLAAVQCLLVLLCFSLNAALGLVVLVLLIAGALNLLLEPRLVRKGWRIVILLLLVFSIDIIHGVSAGLVLRPALVEAGALIAATSSLLQTGAGLSATQFMGIMFGLLLLTNEINLFVRLVFRQFGLEPARDGPLEDASRPPQAGDASAFGIDRQEYNAGRVIGILERWLMYLVVLSTSNLGAIAFIIAAKGLARMKQLEEKVFAEYMLIGTLLSVLSAVLIGKWILMLLAA